MTEEEAGTTEEEAGTEEGAGTAGKGTAGKGTAGKGTGTTGVHPHPPLRGDLSPQGRGESGDCAIVDSGHRRAMDIAIEIPRDFELGPIATHEQWAQTLDQVVELAEQHRTTLVFVNTRRLVERVAHLLSDRLGEENVAAHHGSLSRETRYDTEQRLKEGRVRVCVASASLELGIDIGDIDLVCQIGSPRNIGVALQRVGRSGHFLGGTPKGRFFPLTRDELVETVALLRCIRDGALDALHIPPWPLDVLAQQVVASCVMEEWDEDALYALLTQAYPYRELSRERFDDVVRMLSEGVAGAVGTHDGVPPPRRREPEGEGASRRAHHGSRERRRHTGHGRLPRHRGAGRRDGGDGERGLRHREHGGRHLPARQHAVEDTPHRAGNGARGGGAGAAAHDPVLAGRGAGAHGRAVAGGVGAAARRGRASARPRYGAGAC